MTTFAPGISSDWWGLLTLPSLAIQSVMACRLFRELRLGTIEDFLANDTTIVTSMMFASAASHATSPDTVLSDYLSQMDESRNSEIAPMDPSVEPNDSSDVRRLSRTTTIV